MEIENELPLGYQINEVSKLFFNLIRERCNKQGINGTYTHILRILGCNKDGLSQGDICNYTHFKAPTISLTLQNMENEGLLVRIKNDDDSRRLIVKLTQNGEKLNIRLQEIYLSVEQILTNALNLEEKKMFISCISKIKEKLKGE